jgi:hypothetical protein
MEPGSSNRMRGAILPLPQYTFMVWCLVKHIDDFTFILWNPKVQIELFWTSQRRRTRLESSPLWKLQILNPKVHYCIHKISPLNPILSYVNPVHFLSPCPFQIHCSIIFPSMPEAPKIHIRFRLQIKIMCSFIMSSLHATCRAPFTYPSIWLP